MTSPLTIVSLDPETNDFIFHEDVLANMSLSDRAEEEGLIHLPVAVVSIAGDCRKGKSFLINFFLRYLQKYDQEDWIGDSNEPLTGFSWSHGIDGDTSGIVVWPEPFIMKRKDGKKIAVLLMDTQGLFDDLTDFTKVQQFYAISTLISSVQIYNQLRTIQSNDVDCLSKFSSYGQMVSHKTGHKAFQKLLLLLRDWPNEKEFKFGFVGGRKFLEHKKALQKDKFGEKWSLLNDCYSDIDCFLMPSRGDQANEPEFNGEISQLGPNFINNLKELVPSLLSPEKLITKSWEGKEQKFWQVSNNFSKIARHLEAYGTIQIEKLLSIADEVKASNALSDARLLFVDIAFKGSKKNKDMVKVFVDARKKSLEQFEKETINVDDEYVAPQRKKLLKTFYKFEKNYNYGAKDEEFWKTALKYATMSLLHIGWFLLLGRLTGPLSALFRVFRFVW